MRLHVIAASLAILSVFTVEARAASITYSFAATDFGAPSSFGFSFITPYADGPFNAAVASVGGALNDASGNGATLTGSVTNKVDGTTVFTTPLSCSVGPGAAGAIGSCPGGAGTGTTESAAITTGDGGTLTQTLTFTGSGGGDTAAFTGSAILSGGTTPVLLTWALGVIDFGDPSTFAFTFGLPFLGSHTDLTASLLGAFLDANGDGAAVTGLDLATSIDGTEVTDVAITGSCAGGPGVVVESCLAGLTFSTLVSGPFAAPASGLLQVDILFDLSGGSDAVALTGTFQLFNASTVSEPASLLLLTAGGGALSTLAWVRRRLYARPR